MRRLIFFVTFLQLELSDFLARLLLKHIDTGYRVNATPSTILTSLFETLHVLLSSSLNVNNVWL